MSHLITLSSQVRTLNQLNQLHAQIILHSLRDHSQWLTPLLHCCTRIRAPITYTRLLFESAPHPDPESFTPMFKFYVQSGSNRDVLKLFTQMLHLGLSPAPLVFPFLIKSLGRAATLVHSQILKLGFVNDRYARNAIMNIYVQVGPIEVARRLFDEMPKRSVCDWNSMISGLWRWNCRAEALRMFIRMPDRNVITWTLMVSGLSRRGELEEARKLFDLMPERSVVSWNAMLSGYVQNGWTDEGLSLFSRMVDAGVQPSETTWVTVIMACSTKGDLQLAESLVGSCLGEKWVHRNRFIGTALIKMYAKCGNLARAREIFEEIKFRNLEAWNAMISAYTSKGNLPYARELFEGLPVKDVISWNSMISGYTQNGEWSTAIDLFKEMVRVKDLKPDEVTISSIISACGNLGTLDFGRWVVDFIEKSQIKLSISGYNSLIFMYSRCGSMEDAQKIFKEMPKRDVFSYNSLISGLAATGYALEVLDLLKEMEQEGIEPDRITYIGILAACGHAGLLAEGFLVFKTIKIPTVDHYACMVDLLGRDGQLDEAKRLIDGMPMEPHAGVYGALLNASRIHRQAEIGEFAAQELFKLEPENSGNYVLLSNIYASQRRWGDVDRIWEMMRERGVNKMRGCSWLEFNGVVHQFVSGDQSHCWSGEIYRVLKTLTKKMRTLGYVADNPMF